jgi:putative CocE/NonD family hydrolase
MSTSIVVERGLLVPMRDGVRLSTDVYRPAAAGRYPVLLQRTPYNKGDLWPVATLMFSPFDAVERGYVVVVQDCRGRFASEGEWIPFVVEGPDGHDSVEWAAAQPWSDGRVGIYGSSYNGVTALQAAIHSPPHLVACVAYMTGANYHEGWVYSGGAFELGFGLWYALHQAWDALPRVGLDEAGIAEAAGRLTRAMLDPMSAFRTLPLVDHPLFEGPIAPHWRSWTSHERYDDTWKTIDVIANADKIRVPILHIAAWYDGFLRGHLDLEHALAHHPDARVREEHRLVIGPWEHMAYLGVRKSSAGEREFGPIAVGGPTTAAPLCFDWFDRFVAGRETGAPTAKRVRYFLLGANEWREVDAWPPPHRRMPFYLRGAGGARSRHGDGVLSRDPPGEEPPDGFTHDPRDPVPTLGGRNMIPGVCAPGVQDRSRVEERDDVLVYTTAPLDVSLTIAGPVSATLLVRANAPDADFVAKLVDVEPSGYCVPIAEGILRARFRNGRNREDPLVPGEIATIEVDLLAVAHVFRAGHRIRLEVAGSDFPKYDRNPGTGKSSLLARENDLRRIDQEVLHDAEHSSCIILPVVS